MDVISKERTIDLLVRYWGLGRRLEGDEREVLLAALDEENKVLNGPLHRQALKRLEAKGIT